MNPEQLASFIMNFDAYHLCVSPWRRDPDDGKLSSSEKEREDLRSSMWSTVDGYGIDEHGVAEDDFQVLVHAAQWRNKAFFPGSRELVSPLMVVARSLYDAKLAALTVLQSCQEDADNDDESKEEVETPFYKADGASIKLDCIRCPRRHILPGGKDSWKQV